MRVNRSPAVAMSAAARPHRQLSDIISSSAPVHAARTGATWSDVARAIGEGDVRIIVNGDRVNLTKADPARHCGMFAGCHGSGGRRGRSGRSHGNRIAGFLKSYTVINASPLVTALCVDRRGGPNGCHHDEQPAYGCGQKAPEEPALMIRP